MPSRRVAGLDMIRAASKRAVSGPLRPGQTVPQAFQLFVPPFGDARRAIIDDFDAERGAHEMPRRSAADEKIGHRVGTRVGRDVRRNFARSVRPNPLPSHMILQLKAFSGNAWSG